MESERRQAYVALRAAALGVDDLARKALRDWMTANTSPYTGTPKSDATEPGDVTTACFYAMMRTMHADECRAWRTWFMHWTDYTGRIITPGEHEERIKEIRRTAPASVSEKDR
jgi:hypothetical protein